MTVRIDGVIDEWDDALCCTFGEVRGSAAYGSPALRIKNPDGVLLSIEQARALATWLTETANADERVRALALRAATGPNWLNPRWQRMLWWALRIKSPSLWRVPTLREAWTGRGRL